MDLLAKKRVLPVLIAMAVASSVHAQENIYRMSRVDYFLMHKEEPRPAVSFPSLWTENGVVPPKAVLDLLNEPSEATAREYLAWSRARMEKITAAQKAVDAALRAGEAP